MYTRNLAATTGNTEVTPGTVQRRSRGLQTVFVRTTLAVAIRAFVAIYRQRPAFALLFMDLCPGMDAAGPRLPPSQDPPVPPGGVLAPS